MACRALGGGGPDLQLGEVLPTGTILISLVEVAEPITRGDKPGQ